MDTPTNHPWTVLRFDAGMMADASGWSFIVSVLRRMLDMDPTRRFIVVTDTLVDVHTIVYSGLCRAINGKDVASDTTETIHQRIHRLATELNLPFPSSKTSSLSSSSHPNYNSKTEQNMDEGKDTNEHDDKNHDNTVSSLNSLVSILRKTLTAISLLGESTPRAEARALSIPSLLSAQIGAWYLQRGAHLPAVYMDPRDLLRTALPTGRDNTSESTEYDTYMQADAHSPFFDPETEELLWNTEQRIVVIAGGVGGNDDGHATLLAGKSAAVNDDVDTQETNNIGSNNNNNNTCGGSDITAAVLAGKVGANAVEIFTSSAGLYTYVPAYYEPPAATHVLESARLLRRLSYAEGQEIAATSLSVLHPTAITMLQEHGIPMRIRSRRIYASGSDECTLIGGTRNSINQDGVPAISGTDRNDGNDDAEYQNSIIQEGGKPRVKAICRRNGVVVVSIDSLVMWQQVGFLSTLFDLFRRHRISVDCITTSEANVTVTLDEASPSLAPLLHDIRANCHCTATTVGPCAAISLVGQKIRSVLHSLGPALRLFEDHNIYLLSHAASDVNLTFLVDESDAPRILQMLHECFFSDSLPDAFLGPSYRQLVGTFSCTENNTTVEDSSNIRTRASHDDNNNNNDDDGDRPAITDSSTDDNIHHHRRHNSRQVWWAHPQTRRQLINLVTTGKDNNNNNPGTPPHECYSTNTNTNTNTTNSTAFVYHQPTIRSRAAALQHLPVDRVFYAIKANPNPAVLRTVEAAGLGLECVSLEEIRHVQHVFPHIDPSRILFTPNFVGKHEYVAAFEAGVWVTVDNVFPLMEWGSTVFRGRAVFLRIDPGTGMGHHRKVRTAGQESKFGIPAHRLEEAASLCAEHDVSVIGLHAHVGSGIVDRPEAWAATGRFLAELRDIFPDVRYLDLGGGFGVPEDAQGAVLDMDAVRERLQRFRETHIPTDMEVWVEPGRYVVAEAGILLTTVTQTKSKGTRVYVGVSTGMNTLIRPPLYGSYHQIVNLSRMDEPAVWEADVVGPICESGDVLGHGRLLPRCLSGDVMLVGTAGAYGRSMSSYYNMRAPAREVMMVREEEEEEEDQGEENGTKNRFVDI